ncbi:hypothetical protein ACIPVK_16540 [Paeniglutamicibacter sp. MACA_103]|uniref:hypothetical protein n=1 Tax=Paeniglutamicibacter sp. MACA_103 TaxID=3377337 RepID=UPI0038943704
MLNFTQQTAREPLSGDDLRLTYKAAEVETRLVEEQASAEHVIDHLRTQRAQESTLTAEQARILPPPQGLTPAPRGSVD